MTGRVDHVRREPLPWRTGVVLGQVECGRKGDLSTISRAEWHGIAREWNALVRSYRVAKMEVPALLARPNVCLTCWTTCERWPSWERVPIRALYRELDSFGFYPVGRGAERMCKELWALGRLAADQPDRFDRLVASFDLGYRREVSGV